VKKPTKKQMMVMFIVLGIVITYAGGLIGLIIFLIITFIAFYIDYKRAKKK